MKAVDVVANLRYPTMGESSGSLFHALAWGKPILVSDNGAFSEIPDKVTWKADPFTDEIEVLTLFIENLAKVPAARESMSYNARNFIAKKALLENVAETYLFAITSRD
jgi:glycosyltransferase involved in cell wall biosynthesis